MVGKSECELGRLTPRGYRVFRLRWSLRSMDCATYWLPSTAASQRSFRLKKRARFRRGRERSTGSCRLRVASGPFPSSFHSLRLLGLAALSWEARDDDAFLVVFRAPTSRMRRGTPKTVVAGIVHM